MKDILQQNNPEIEVGATTSRALYVPYERAEQRLRGPTIQLDSLIFYDRRAYERSILWYQGDSVVWADLGH